MQKDTRELKEFVNRRVLDKYPLVTSAFEETSGHHVKIVLGAPNGRSTTLYCTAGGDPSTRYNIERDVKQALRKLNIALDKEDRTMASIKTQEKVVHAFRDLAKAADLNAEIDTGPKEALLQVNGTARHPVKQPSPLKLDYTQAQTLRDQGKTLRQISQITNISIPALSQNTKPARAAPALVKAAPPVATPAKKTRAAPQRKTQAEVFKVGMLLSLRCQLVDGFAVYEADWSDQAIAEQVGCDVDDVRELRVKHIGKTEAETPKSQINPDARALLKRIMLLEAKVSRLEGLPDRVQLLEDAVTKP
jgi:hypothetical protein